MSDLWFITCHFNAAGFRAPVRNYETFARRLRSQGGKLLTVECAFLDRPHELAEGLADRTVRLRSQSILWQKERLLAHAVSLLPPHCAKVCWVDSDILFESSEHLERISRGLDSWDVVQCFDRVRRLFPGQSEFADHNPEGFPLWDEHGAANALLGGHGLVDTSFGFAWAARLDFLRRVGGLYDRAILGGGDSLFLQALFPQIEQQSLSVSIDADLDRWKAGVRQVSPRVDFIPGTCCHLYHGSLEHRSYFTRHELLLANSFDPTADIYRINDVWEWATLKPALHQAVRDYFISRREDEVSA